MHTVSWSSLVTPPLWDIAGAEHRSRWGYTRKRRDTLDNGVIGPRLRSGPWTLATRFLPIRETSFYAISFLLITLRGWVRGNDWPVFGQLKTIPREFSIRRWIYHVNTFQLSTQAHFMYIFSSVIRMQFSVIRYCTLNILYIFPHCCCKDYFLRN